MSSRKKSGICINPEAAEDQVEAIRRTADPRQLTIPCIGPGVDNQPLFLATSDSTRQFTEGSGAWNRFKTTKAQRSEEFGNMGTAPNLARWTGEKHRGE